MKKDIHPKYDLKTKATCACGAVFEVGSTMPEIKMEICSQCHPFYTGQMKFLDTTGRVERFKQTNSGDSKCIKQYAENAVIHGNTTENQSII